MTNFRSAAAFGAVSRALAIGIRFASVPLLITLLSPERYGLWLILGSLIGWLGFSDLGVPAALQNRLIALRREGREQEGRALVGFAFRFLGAIAGGIFLLGAALAWFLPWEHFFKIEPGVRGDFVAALLMSLFTFAVALPARIGSVLYSAHGRLAVPPLTDVIAQAAGFGMLLLVVWLHWGSLVVLSASALLGLLIGPLLLTALACRRYGYGPVAPRPRPEDRRALMGKGFFFFVTLLGELLVLQSDAFVIGLVLGAASVPLYLIPATLWMNFLQAQNIFLRPLWPMLTHAYTGGDRPAVLRLVRRGLFYSLGGGLVFATGLVLLGDWFIRFWSKGAVTLPPIMAWGFGAYVVTASLDNILATFLNAWGLIEVRFGYTLLFGLTKVGMAILVLQHAGIAWLPWAFAASMAITSLPFAIYFVRRALRRMPTFTK